MSSERDDPAAERLFHASQEIHRHARDLAEVTHLQTADGTATQAASKVTAASNEASSLATMAAARVWHVITAAAGVAVVFAVIFASSWCAPSSVQTIVVQPGSEVAGGP